MSAGVDLWWLPLGAGGWFVRTNGLLFEAVAARLGRRERRDLYHSALEVHLAGERWVIEMTPAWGGPGTPAGRGVVAQGSVGVRGAGRLRALRYEVRRWRGGEIPDLAEAVGGPRRVSADPAVARAVLALVPWVPTPTWGRDGLRTGDMWNSNSVVSWVLVRAGVDLAGLGPPPGGRAPGWDAGAAVAHRETRDPRGPAGALRSASSRLRWSHSSGG